MLFVITQGCASCEKNTIYNYIDINRAYRNNTDCCFGKHDNTGQKGDE